MHPDVAALAGLSFGELPLDRARRVEQHLTGCARCREEFERLLGSIDTEQEAESAAAADREAMLRKLRAWEATTADSGRRGETLKRRMARELAPYLGKAGAEALLYSVNDDGGDLLADVAPLLTMFLGRRAATRLISRVVEKTVVGSHTLCES